MQTPAHSGQTGNSVKGLLIALSIFFMIIFLVMEIQRGNQLDRKVDELVRSVNRVLKVPANAGDSDKAIALGREAVKKGDWGVGQLYLVNAVTNAPRRLDHLNAYASAVLEGSNAPTDAVERLASILQLAAYQVDSADVPKVLALIDRVEQARKPAAATDEANPAPAKALDWPARWDLVLAGIRSDAWADPGRLNVALRSIEGFAADIEEQGGAPPEVHADVASKLNHWTEIAQVAKQCRYVDACLGRLEPGKGLSTERAVSIVQAAENVLPNFWGVDPSAIPADLKAKIDGYPDKIKAKVEEIGMARSLETLNSIKEKLAASGPSVPGPSDAFKPQPAGYWQVRYKGLEDAVKISQKLAMKLTSTRAVEEVQKLIEEKSRTLQACRGRQYLAYQQWAIEWSEKAHNNYLNVGTIENTIASTSAAKKIFDDLVLAEIDQSLLTPEVSRIFNDVLGKILGMMKDPKVLVAAEKEMGTHAKKKLEDF